MSRAIRTRPGRAETAVPPLGRPQHCACARGSDRTAPRRRRERRCRQPPTRGSGRASCGRRSSVRDAGGLRRGCRGCGPPGQAPRARCCAFMRSSAGSAGCGSQPSPRTRAGSRHPRNPRTGCGRCRRRRAGSTRSGDPRAPRPRRGRLSPVPLSKRKNWSTETLPARSSAHWLSTRLSRSCGASASGTRRAAYRTPRRPW